MFDVTKRAALRDGEDARHRHWNTARRRSCCCCWRCAAFSRTCAGSGDALILYRMKSRRWHTRKPEEGGMITEHRQASDSSKSPSATEIPRGCLRSQMALAALAATGLTLIFTFLHCRRSLAAHGHTRPPRASTPSLPRHRHYRHAHTSTRIHSRKGGLLFLAKLWVTPP